MNFKAAQAAMKLGMKVKHRVWGHKTLYLEQANNTVYVTYANNTKRVANMRSYEAFKEGWSVYDEQQGSEAST